MIDYRVFYQKQGNAKYISHLDVNRCMQRAFKRTGLPVWYSQGFNPHIYIAFALPLSLGFESRYEVMDFRLNEERSEEAIQQLLSGALNPDFGVWKVARPVNDPKKICWSEYTICMAPNLQDEEQFYQLFCDFLQWPEISMTKKGKKGDKLINLTPLVRDATWQKTDQGQLQLTAKFAAGVGENLNPSLLTDAFALYHPQMPFVVSGICRTGIYDTDGTLFV